MAEAAGRTNGELLAEIAALAKRVRELELEASARRRAVDENPATLEALMENIPEGVTLISAPGVIKMVSRYALDFLGVSKEEIQDMPVPDFFSKWKIFNPDGTPVSDEDRPITAASRGVVTRDREFIFTSHGKSHTILINSSPIKDGTGKLIGAITVWKEITTRKEAEEVIRHEKDLLRKVLEILPVGVWIMDRSGRIVEANPAGRRIWGGARYVGVEDFGEYIAWWPETGKRIEPHEWAAARAIEKGETTIDEEIEIQRFDGTRAYILNSSMPLKEGTEITGAIIVNQDITVRKKAENALRENERMLAEAQGISRLGNWVWNLEQDSFFGSEETYKIFELAQGTPVDYKKLFGMVHPEDRLKLDEALAASLRGEVHKIDFRIVLPSGKTKYVHALGITDFTGGKPVSMKGTIQDITERKAQEEKQLRLVEELKDALARIKTLSGLIPICANCKRIRDDKGYWTRIEKYIEEHSAAEFTHSLCPDCERKLYGKENSGPG